MLAVFETLFTTFSGRYLPTKNISTLKGEPNEEQIDKPDLLHGCCPVFLYHSRRRIRATKIFGSQLICKARFRRIGGTTGNFLNRNGTNSRLRGHSATAE